MNKKIDNAGASEFDEIAHFASRHDTSAVPEEHRLQIGRDAVKAALSEAQHIIGSHVMSGFTIHEDVKTEPDAYRFAFQHVLDNHC